MLRFEKDTVPATNRMVYAYFDSVVEILQYFDQVDAIIYSVHHNKKTDRFLVCYEVL